MARKTGAVFYTCKGSSDKAGSSYGFQTQLLRIYNTFFKVTTFVNKAGVLLLSLEIMLTYRSEGSGFSHDIYTLKPCSLHKHRHLGGSESVCLHPQGQGYADGQDKPAGTQSWHFPLVCTEEHLQRFLHAYDSWTVL